MIQRMLSAAAAVALVLAVLLLPAAARAQADGPVQRVAVVRLDFVGEVPEAGRDLFERRLAEGLSVARFEVLAGAPLGKRLKSAGKLAGCADASCYPNLARQLNVGYLVMGRVNEQNKTYFIFLELINGRTGAVLASNRERCETCGIEEAGEKMTLAASSLRARLEAVARTPARFVIRSRPDGARASIDGRAVGRTPLDIELAGGEHRLMLELGGHDPLQRTFIVVSGVDETLEYDLVQQPTTFPYRAVGWTSLVVGVLALGTGIFALVIDGNEVPCPASQKDGMNHCPLVRDTAALGAVLVGVGAVSTTVGGVSLFLDSRGGTAPEPSLGARLRLGFRGQF